MASSASAALGPLARAAFEFTRLQKCEILGMSLQQCTESLPLHWKVSFNDVDLLRSSPYAGMRFQLEVTIDSDFPRQPPTLVFAGDPPLHPHVYSNGFICLESLYRPQWTEKSSIYGVICSVLVMLASTRESDMRRPTGDLELVRSHTSATAAGFGTSASDPRKVPWVFHDTVTSKAVIPVRLHSSAARTAAGASGDSSGVEAEALRGTRDHAPVQVAVSQAGADSAAEGRPEEQEEYEVDADFIADVADVLRCQGRGVRDLKRKLCYTSAGAVGASSAQKQRRTGDDGDAHSRRSAAFSYSAPHRGNTAPAASSGAASSLSTAVSDSILAHYQLSASSAPVQPRAVGLNLGIFRP